MQTITHIGYNILHKISKSIEIDIWEIKIIINIVIPKYPKDYCIDMEKW